MTRYLVIAGLLLAVAGRPAEAGERIAMPSGVFYYQPASTSFSGEALWSNPAGLARYNAMGFQVMGDYFDGRILKSTGFVVNRQGFGVAHRSIHQPDDSTIREWVVGAALRFGKDLLCGASFDWYTNGPKLYDNRKQWNVGVLKQGGGPFSIGVVAGNLNRSRLDGERTETELRYSAAYRPLRDKITLSVDAFMSTKTRFKNGDFVYHAEVTPVQGLYVDGFVDSHQNFQIGARVNLVRSFLGAKGGFDKSGHERGTTMYAGTTSLRQPSIVREPNTRLYVPLSNFGGENPAHPVFGRSLSSFTDLILTLYRASQDESIREVVIVADQFGLSFAQAQEVRQALINLKQSGKKITFFDAAPGNLSYYMASAADRIIIPPVSQVGLVGLRAELTFYGGTLDKLGIKAEILRIGEYKTAAEAYTRSSATDENKAQINRLLDGLYAQLVRGISEGRKISVDSVRTLVDHGPYTSADALKAGMVDALVYQDELTDQLKPRMRNLGYAYYARDTVTTGDWQSPPTIAVVVADGEIVGKNNQGTPLDRETKITAPEMMRALDQARQSRNVKGVLFRVDSPGGDALASDVIAHAADKTARAKPMVISMSGVAASGGYYIATAGAHMFASPGTITGSIGIFGGKLDMSRLYDKVALGKELYTRGRFSGILTTTRAFTDDERAKYMDQLQGFYGHFCELVAKSRSLAADSVDHLGRGRVWTGEEARSNGLVDELGGVWESLQYLQSKTGLTRYRIAVYPQRRPLFVFPGGKLLSAAVRLVAGGGGQATGDDSPFALAPDVRLVARVPYDIDIR
jgi:protease IV